ncbi:MAG: alpha-dextran endo-1,6-alpha-glucosidase [Oligoflexia bacterium]|nr:MAG: alpha-dextran endo-1,6-alpha-glucosidase [Oligoflexia bacterium]
MHLLKWLIFICLFQLSAQAVDVPFASAIWKNSSEIQLSVPSSRYFQSGVSYYLLAGENFEIIPGRKYQFKKLIPLPPIHFEGNQISFSTKEISSQIPDLIREPLSLLAVDNQSRLMLKTYLQLAPLLDLQFSTNLPLGLSWNQNTFTLRLWAPTARSVHVLFYRSSHDREPFQSVPLEYNRGLWSLTGSSGFKNAYYQFQVQVFSPHTERVETFTVTDPYSISLSKDSQRSQVINPEDSELKPVGWDTLQKPQLEHFSDITVYESHIRDLTANDPTLKPEYRGSFLGLASPTSSALRHLSSLAESGLTHLHLLPLMDFATVSEDRSLWKKISFTNPPRPQSPLPQDELDKIKNEDAYNWGYDPVHYMTPDGSYTLEPDGASRVYELRSLVQSLNQHGLRLIMDVVFNHTYASGAERFSVFDRIVPLYYYRLNQWGDLYKSSCCSDLATEHKMVEKLMVDSVVYLARTYKIDGFRFDLMNLHTEQNMTRVLEAVRSLNLQNDGVDGEKIYLYGEAWPFGSLEEKYPGAGLFQTRSYGQGIGVFNDRMRDALRGGTTDSREKSDQGFATGLFYDFNEEPANRNTPINLDDQRWKLLHLGDVIKIGLVGNLRDYRLRDHRNNMVRAGDLYFRDAPVGYAAEATETINYASAHDGYALWDAIQAKMPFSQKGRNYHVATEEEKVRSHRLMLAIVAFGQGIPFFEGGSELLRSKSGDVDSYNSGDWFNALDWSQTTNNWGAGLPPHWRNLNDWSFWQPRLENSSMGVATESIQTTAEYFKALLKVRQTTPLFKLNTLEEIQKRVSFPTDDRFQTDIPGFLVMRIEPGLYIFFNATNSDQLFYSAKTKGHKFGFHPALTEKVDPALKRVGFDPQRGIFQLPARSTVVLGVMQ